MMERVRWVGVGEWWEWENDGESEAGGSGRMMERVRRVGGWGE